MNIRWSVSYDESLEMPSFLESERFVALFVVLITVRSDLIKLCITLTYF